MTCSVSSSVWENHSFVQTKSLRDFLRSLLPSLTRLFKVILRNASKLLCSPRTWAMQRFTNSRRLFSLITSWKTSKSTLTTNDVYYYVILISFLFLMKKKNNSHLFLTLSFLQQVLSRCCFIRCCLGVLSVQLLSCVTRMPLKLTLQL